MLGLISLLSCSSIYRITDELWNITSALYLYSAPGRAEVTRTAGTSAKLWTLAVIVKQPADRSFENLITKNVMMETELRAQFQVMEDNLNGAYEKNDAEKISNLLADDWVILEPSTGLSGKEQFLQAIKDGSLTHSSMKKGIVQIRSYNDFAIVITRGRNEGHYLDKPFGSEQWVTNIYRKIDQQWICVMTQEAAVTCQ